MEQFCLLCLKLCIQQGALACLVNLMVWWHLLAVGLLVRYCENWIRLVQ